MSEDIKLSVIIPVFNTEKYLEKCLNSLLAQTLEDIEIICVDDLSTDSSYDILLRYEKENPDKILVIKLEEKLRQGGARNKGISIARGKYIAFVDSDDYVSNNMYEILYTLAEKSQAEYVQCGCMKVYSDHEEEHKLINYDMPSNCGIEINTNNRGYFMVSSGSIWAGIYQRSLFVDNFIAFPENLAYEDNYVGPIIRYLVKKYAYVEDCLYYYNRANATATTAIKNSPHHLDRIVTANMLLNWFKTREDYNEVKEAVEYIYLELFYIHTVSCIIYHYKKTDYAKIKEIRNKFLKEFPNYKINKYYCNKFSKIRRMTFLLNEISPFLYVRAYKLFRLISKLA